MAALFEPSMLLLTSILVLAGPAWAATCQPAAFEKSLSSIFGVQILNVFADEVIGWNEGANPVTYPPLPVVPQPIDFCNVTVQYTYPGLDDVVRVNVWLPLKNEDWNGRFLGQGGGGWAAGAEGSLWGGVAMGMATANTDGGHSNLPSDGSEFIHSKHWGLASPGNVNLNRLRTFAYRSLDDLASIGKAVTKQYYGKDISYSYWNGCSTGGRQGLSLAQRYPSQFQGILAAAPAINWVTFVVVEHYAHVKMQELKYFPPGCELAAITQAAIEACDELDGVKDGVISAHGLCQFDAKSVIGKKYICDGDNRKITKEAAEIANTAWTGPLQDGKPLWFGE